MYKKAFSLVELSIVILIIGLLISGITKGSQLYQKMIHKITERVTKESPVNIISGLEAWYETSRAESFADSVADGSLVSAWNDTKPSIFGKEHSANKAANSNNRRPIYIENAFKNSIAGLKFDGSDNCLVDDDLAINSEITIFTVMRRESYIMQKQSIAIAPADANSAYSGIIVFWEPINNPNIMLSWRDGAYFGMTHPGTDVDFIATAIYRNNNTAAMYINGKTNNNKSSFNTNFLSNITRITMGCRATGSGTTTSFSYGYDGYIGEVIVYNRALKNSEREQVENYLSQKFNIDLNET